MKRSLYFENRAEYYRRKEAGLEYRIQVETTKPIKRVYKTYFVNFEIAEAKGYIVGSLSSPKKIPMAEAKRIIRSNCGAGYTPINFYEAVEYQRQFKTKFVLMREDNLIDEVNFDV